MIKLFETLGRYSFQCRRNGYSLAEIMLVFGIIAIILTSVWATYAVLIDEADALAAIAEIQLIRKAANDYKNVPIHMNKYSSVGTDLSNLESYLGQNVLLGSVNMFGGTVAIAASSSNLDLDVTYPSVHSKDICHQILEYFGKVRSSGTDLYIRKDDTISGYIADGTIKTTGCERITDQDYALHIRID